MKAKKIIGLLSCLIGFSLFSTSCEDMLTPELKRYAKDFNGNDTVNFYLGIMGDVQDVIEQNYLLGDLRSDVATTTDYTSDSIANIMNFNRQPDGENLLLNRSAYYKVINQCNFYLNKVDTLAAKNGNFYMRREAAQVLTLRAWTYMQLVQNYGRVPFITQPVRTANTGWEKNPEAWATVDNLLDLLKEDVMRALRYQVSYGLPDYGTFQLGNSDFPHKLMIFYPRLVLADLYLLRGHDRNDYLEAAHYYYDYLVKDLKTNLNVSTRDRAKYFLTKMGNDAENNKDNFEPSAFSWMRQFHANTSVITSIPSTANNVFGKVLTQIPHIYGYDTQSFNTTVGLEPSKEGKEQAQTSGSMNLIANYKHVQVGVSPRLEAMAKDRTFVFASFHGDELEQVYYLDKGDARIYGTRSKISEDHATHSLISKVVKGGNQYTTISSKRSFDFNNKIGVYRKTQVLLRFAEAINRAGFPRHAFAVLHGGLVAEKMPKIKYVMKYDDVNKTKQKVYLLDSITTGAGANNFISIDELRRAKDVEFLQFTSTEWSDPSAQTMNPNFCGIRDLGCGMQLYVDTVNTYDKLVGQRIANEALRRAGMVLPTPTMHRSSRIKAAAGSTSEEDEELAKQRETYKELEPVAPASADPKEIDAVESLIADETAMENSFFGTRYYDLMRIARHKNNDNSGLFPADNGTRWFAWQIARRNVNAGLYEDIQNYDKSIFNLLLNQENWYLRNPQYSTK